MSTFYTYFKENMESLGLPAPETLFSTLQAAVANAAILLSHIDKYGKAITIGELIGAGTKLEKLGVAASLAASFYVGAVIGSIAVASGRTLAGGTSLADVLLVANQYQLNRSWLAGTLTSAPRIYQRSSTAVSSAIGIRS